MKTTKFKMTELGPIPVDWEVKRLGECCARIKNGFTYSVCNRGGYKISRIETISKGVVNYSRVGYVKDAPPAEYMLSNGDILFSHINSLPYIGNVALYDGKELLYHGMNLLLLRCNERANANYLYYALSSAPMRSRARELAKIAINQASISIGDLSQSEIPLPPLAEQRRIAGALSDVDELILALGKRIEKKRNIKTGAMQELLGMRNEECGMRNVPRRRLPGFSGEWVEKRFDDCFELIGNNTYARECMCDDCDGLANIHYGDVLIRYGAVLDCSRVAVPSLINSIICRTDRLSDGDVIIADTAEDETVGKAIEIRGLKGRRAVSGLHTIACRPRFDFAPGWLGYYINSSAFHDQLLPLITGTKVSSISKAGLRTTILNVPTLAEQKAIAAVLSDIDAEIAALEADRAKYEHIKSGMMQELLTGKTRLNGEYVLT